MITMLTRTGRAKKWALTLGENGATLMLVWLLQRGECDFSGEVPVLRGTGTSTVEEIFEALDEIVGHPDFPCGSNLIMDITRSATKRTYGETQAVAHHLGRHHDAGRLGPLVVFVVAKPHQYGLVRQGSVFTEKYGLHVVPCYDFQEALKWVSEKHAGRKQDEDTTYQRVG